MQSTSTLNMFNVPSGGMAELEELLNNDKGVGKTIRKSPKLWKAASLATIPASLALGYGIVPTSKIAFSAAGAVATSVAGIIGRSKIKDLGGEAVMPAIIECLVQDGISSPQTTAGKILEIKDKYAVHPDDFTWTCVNVYRKFLLGMIKYDAKPQSSELTELENLKEALSLNNLDVGDAHELAAEDWVLACKFVEDMDDEECKERLALNKLLYLTERALRQNDEPHEAFIYEMTKTAKVFGLSYSEALERVEEVVEPFYERALKSSRSKLGTNQVSSTMLERARKTLGVDPDMAKSLHEDILSEEIRSLLGYTEEVTELDPYTTKYPEGAAERLEQLREILDLKQVDLDYEILNEGMQLFNEVGRDVMKDAVAGDITSEEAFDRINQRRMELMIPEDRLNEVMSNLVVTSMGMPLQEVKKYLDVNNQGGVYDSVIQVLEAKSIIIYLLEKSGWEGDFYASFCNPNLESQSINSLMNSKERKEVYELVTTRAAEVKTEEELIAFKAEMQGIMGIEEKQVSSISTANFGPKLRDLLEKAMNEIVDDYTPTLVETLEKEVADLISKYELDEGLIELYGGGNYQKALDIISATAPAGVPSKEQNEALRALQKFYRLDDVSSMHTATFGSVYKKSIEEAMSITGVIRPEYRQPLEDLRDRLGVSKEQTQSIFLDAVKKRMAPMVQWIVSEMEKTIFTQEQLSQRRGKDMGEDYFQTGKKADGNLGIGAEINVLSDMMNLVDFYEENDIAVKKQVTNKVEKTIEEDGVMKIVEEEELVNETFYPITAMGIGSVDEKMAEVLFRQFVVGSFTTQGPNAVRYETSRDTFGGILGLSPEKMKDIGGNVADTVYENYVGQSMRTKGALDQQDMMFLANLQTKLGLTAEEGEKFLKKSQGKLLNEELDKLMKIGSPEEFKAFREKCEGMGIGIIDDLETSKERVIEMFEIEVGPGLVSGEITVKNGDILAEVQDSLGLDEEDAEDALRKFLLAKSKKIAETIEGAIRRGRIGAIVDPVKELIRYGSFLNGELEIKMEEEVGQQVYNTYGNFDREGMSEEEFNDSQDMLKTILSLD